jgi:VWFA-related protein
MKTTQIFVSIIFLGLGLTIISNAQKNSASEKDYKIQVGVEEVRIDAVVLDNKGNQVTDLTADDFEIYQDGKFQKINSSTYVAGPQKLETTVTSPEASEAELLVSKPKLSKDKVQRTIAFLVYGAGADPRPHLRKFVESQMAPGDMVAILGAGPQVFSSDKRELLARIKSIPEPPPPYGFSCVNAAIGSKDTFAVADAILSGASTGAGFDSFVDWITPNEEYIKRFKADISPIRYAVRALQDMPGRKYLVLTREGGFSDARRLPKVQNRLLNEAADEAWRAGVVISTWDYCNTQIGNPFGKFNVLFKKTGGIYTDDNNFLYKGKPALDTLAGYYLLSYTPPANTFNTVDIKSWEKYHKIGVYVKRPGTKVFSRDGFFASPSSSNFASAPQANTLLQAMVSPLVYNDLKFSLSSSYANTLASGYFLRSWMHLDGKDLTFKEEEEDEYSLSLELQAATSDSSGAVQDAKGFQYDFRLSEADVLRIRKDGMDLKTYLPVRNPGYYYVSVAIKDRTSGKIGSGYQFLDIPDLSKLRLSLSSIFVLSSEKDESVIKTGNIREDGDSFNTMRKWQAMKQSPALRTYKPGEKFDYMTVVYNAKNKINQAPKLEFQSTLYREGLVYRQEKPEEINLDGVADPGRIPIAKSVVFDSAMDDGDYVLLLKVTDKPASEKSHVTGKPRIAFQAIDIKIRK